MKLSPIVDYNSFKKQFAKAFRSTVNENSLFKSFIYELLIQGTAYVIGGYIRDLSLNQEPRDLDLMVDIPNKDLIDLLSKSGLAYKVNRLNGIKIVLPNFEVDMWSIQHNWAFEKKLVSINEDYILENIGDGCFYNYDSLVVNVHTNNVFFKHYNDMIKSNTLDILQKNTLYKKLNPTIEANILRAFFLRSKFDLQFSENCNSYLISRIGFLSDKYGSAFQKLKEYRSRYPKYESTLTDQTIIKLMNYCNSRPKQGNLDFTDDQNINS